MSLTCVRIMPRMTLFVLLMINLHNRLHRSIGMDTGNEDLRMGTWEMKMVWVYFA